MTAAALHLDRPSGAGRGGRWLVFVACAAALFVFSYGSDYTWSAVQRAWSEGFGASVDSAVKQSAAGNRSRQAAAIALGLLGAGAMVSRRRAAALRPAGLLGALALAYVALVALSVGWADEPWIGARRLIALALLLTAVAGLVRLLPRDALVSFALFGSTAYVLVAVAAEAAGGAALWSTPQYRFSGVYHPNTLGSFAAILVLAVTSIDVRRVRPALLALAVAGGTAVLLLTRSRSALAGLAVALVVRSLVAARLSRAVFALAVCAWLGCAAVLTFGDAAGRVALAALVAGRTDSDVETLSGRTALWDELLRHVSDRPVLGYGFGSFWDARRIQELYAALRWPVTDAHSTYVQQLLDVGVIGLALYLLVVGGALARAVRRLRATGDRSYAFMIGVLVHLSVVGSLETVHPNPGFLTFLLLWTLASLAFGDGAPAGGRSRCASP